MNADSMDRDRYPTLGDPGRRMLQRLREHPAAPIYRNQSGNRLTTEDLASLREFESEVLSARIDTTAQGVPDWISEFTAQVFSDVPYYRALGSRPLRFEDLPVVDRGMLAADIAKFVPDSVAVDRLINFRTTGTTGQPLLVPSHPLVAGRYLAFHKRALRRFGVAPEHGRDQVGVVILGHQRKCFTYVSVTPAMDESGLAKINLHPDDWRDPDDRWRYLDSLGAEIFAGDPISFAELLKLPTSARPRALISVSMALSPGLRAELGERFGCPVLDVYSLNEVGPVAVFDSSVGGHVLLQPSLHVEILDPEGRGVATGTRGEITVTGGFNFCLPLLRYRTGDFGALSAGPDAPVIVGLCGRQPIRFRNAAGQWFNNIDVSHALGTIPLSRYSLHQAADGHLRLALAPGEMGLAATAAEALRSLFPGQAIGVESIGADDKLVQYSSDLAGARV
ncbi:MAG: AMP-binding protein [Porticoccaceae bacterium]